MFNFLLVLLLTKLVNELEIEVLIFVFQVRGLWFLHSRPCVWSYLRSLLILTVVAIVIVFKVVFKDCDSNFETDIFSIFKV